MDTRISLLMRKFQSVSNFLANNLWKIFFVILLMISLRGYLKMKSERQIETPEQKICQDGVIDRYWKETDPVLRASSPPRIMSVEENIANLNKASEQLKILDQKYLVEWWDCHIKYIDPKDKLLLDKQGRWQEYINLVNLLPDILDRYDNLKMKTEILADYGHLHSAEEIRAMHPKIKSDQD
jgi:hypothetical protein